MYYDRAGNVIPMTEWAIRFEDPEYKRVALTQFSADQRVSTVWLGVDHSFRGGGPIEIFETMAFGFEGFEVMARYATEEQALEGHYRCVREVVSEPRNWVRIG